MYLYCTHGCVCQLVIKENGGGGGGGHNWKESTVNALVLCNMFRFVAACTSPGTFRHCGVHQGASHTVSE